MHHAADHLHVAVEDAGLHGVGGVSANRTVWSLEADAVEHRGAVEERCGSETDAGGDRAAQVIALARDSIEDACGAEVDDHHRRLVTVERCNGVEDAVWADLSRIVVEHSDAGLHTRSDDERLHIEVAADDLAEGGE